MVSKHVMFVPDTSLIQIFVYAAAEKSRQWYVLGTGTFVNDFHEVHTEEYDHSMQGIMHESTEICTQQTYIGSPDLWDTYRICACGWI